jgi:predicted dehydrogenase
MFLIVGLGNQGSKRFNVLSKLGKVITVDPFNVKANHKDIYDVNFNEVEFCYICVPEIYKEKILDHCINMNKHIFIEKPVLISETKLKSYQASQLENNKNFKVGYSLNYEPHIIEWKNYFKNNLLGDHYYSNLTYGNGTALNVKNEKWRDSSSGVFQDLGIHLVELFLEICEGKKILINKVNPKNYENLSFDYCIFEIIEPYNWHCEVSFLEWENKFSIHSVFEKGIVKVSGLDKWGSASISVLERIYPSGKPEIKLHQTFINSGAFEKETISLLANFKVPEIGDIEKTIFSNLIMSKMLKGIYSSES